MLEGIYVVAHLLAPFLPRSCTEIFEKLGTPPRPIPELSAAFDNLAAGTEINAGCILYPKLEVLVAEGESGV